MKSPLRNAVRRYGKRVTMAGAAAMAAVIVFTSAAHAGVDTVSDTPMTTTTFNNEVWSVAYAGNTIYVGGVFTAAISGGKSTPRAGLAAINATTGALLPWSPSVTGTVKAIVVDGTHIYLGGAFTNVDKVARTNLAEVDATTGALVTTFNHSLTGGEVRSMVTGNGLLYAGGTFTSADGTSRPYLSAYSLSTGARNTTWAPVPNNYVSAVAFGNNQVYVGGLFSTLDGATNGHLRALDPNTGAVAAAFKPLAPYEVYGIAIGASGVYAAVGGPGGRAIGYTSTGTTLWTVTADGDTQTINVLDQTVYVGGHFDYVCKTSQTGARGACVGGSQPGGKMFAVDLSGAVIPWNPQMDGIHGVHQIAVNEALHTIAAAGSFPHVKGVNHHGFAEFG